MSHAPDTVSGGIAPAEQPALFEHVTVENEDYPDECAFVPPESSSAPEATTWILAVGDGFVDRAAMR